MDRKPLAVDVDLALKDSTDPRAPGGEITVALCGHWEHEGPCRWPHNNRIATDASPAHVRSVIIVPDDEHAEVLERIETILRNDGRWSVLQITPGDITKTRSVLAATASHAHSEDRPLTATASLL